jgi:putative MATE family efflux protein
MSLSIQQDTTRSSLGRDILRLAWPITISQVLLMAPTIYDALWLGRLSATAQAAAGLTMAVRFAMISVLMALSVASGAVVARHVGARDSRGANLAALQGVILMVVASGGLGIVGLVLARPLLVLAGADAATLPVAERYARVIFAGLVALELVPSMGFMLSAAGSPQVLLGMTACSTGTLLVAEPLLVRAIGIEGAGLALVGSNAVGVAFGLIVMFSGRAAVRFDRRNLRLDLPMMGRILRVALPSVLQRGTPNLAMALLLRMVASYGESTLAGWVVARSVCEFVIIPALGLARSTPALVGQSLGAARPERAARSVRLIARLALLVLVLVFGLLAVLAPQVTSWLAGDADAAAAGARAIRAVAVGYVALGLTYVFDGALSGAGDTVSPMVINLMALWAVQVPLAFLLSRVAGLGAQGIWVALVFGWIVQATLTGLRFRQGRWKFVRV